MMSMVRMVHLDGWIVVGSIDGYQSVGWMDQWIVTALHTHTHTFTAAAHRRHHTHRTHRTHTPPHTHVLHTTCAHAHAHAHAHRCARTHAHHTTRTATPPHLHAPHLPHRTHYLRTLRAHHTTPPHRTAGDAFTAACMRDIFRGASARAFLSVYGA